jgi:hypothetical protein
MRWLVNVKSSIITSLLLVAISTYLITRLSKHANSNKYERKEKNTWNSLSEGIDPTDE